MTTRLNPALYQEPRNQPMKIIPPLPRESLMSWLESSGRFRSTEVDEFPNQIQIMSEDLDDILEPDLYTQEAEEEQME